MQSISSHWLFFWEQDPGLLCSLLHPCTEYQRRCLVKEDDFKEDEPKKPQQMQSTPELKSEKWERVVIIFLQDKFQSKGRENCWVTKRLSTSEGAWGKRNGSGPEQCDHWSREKYSEEGRWKAPSQQIWSEGHSIHLTNLWQNQLPYLWSRPGLLSTHPSQNWRRMKVKGPESTVGLVFALHSPAWV